MWACGLQIRSALPWDGLGCFLGEGRDRSPPCPVPPHALCSATERVVSVVSELQSVRAREGDGATFECTVSEVETAGSWKLGGRPTETRRPRPHPTGRSGRLSTGSGPWLPRPGFPQTTPHYDKSHPQPE